jgi:hypothetical protein
MATHGRLSPAISNSRSFIGQNNRCWYDITDACGSGAVMALIGSRTPAWLVTTCRFISTSQGGCQEYSARRAKVLLILPHSQTLLMGKAVPSAGPISGRKGDVGRRVALSDSMESEWCATRGAAPSRRVLEWRQHLLVNWAAVRR